MKILRIILITAGVLLIFFNVIAWIGRKPERLSVRGMNMVAYYIGANIFIILGSLFFLIAYFLGKKIKQKTTGLVDSFLE